ncbi:MAG: hypothetical protein AB7T48_06675 [Solirubrobacterales bacterium]
MSQDLLAERPVSVLDPPAPPAVQPTRPPKPESSTADALSAEIGPLDLSPRAIFRRRCERLAQRLATASFEDRIAIYTDKEDRPTYRELSSAAALCPDLMPVLNGEYEWIALTSADLLD